MIIGSDPELFVKRKGEFVPAIGLFGGDKDNPVQHGEIGVQEDNVMVEFNIPPCSSEQMLRDYMHLGFNTINNLLPSDHELAIVSTAEFNPKYLKSKKARESGCDPDIDAWEMGFRRSIPMTDNFRYSGGHVHIQLSEDEMDDFDFVINLVRSLDIHLAVPATKYDKDVRRRNKYGKPGAYRDKPYGIEYRSLSNFWIKDYIGFIWDGVHKAYEYAKEVEITEDRKKEVYSIL